MKKTLSVTLFSLLTNRGLGRSLLLIFLITALFPIILVSFVHYRNSKQLLVDQVHLTIEEVTHSETLQLQNYFDHKLAHLIMLSQMEQNITFLKRLKKELAESGMSPEQFNGSRKWIELPKVANDLNLFLDTLAINNILMADSDGNVLYSVVDESSLGTNLLTDPNSKTLLGEAIGKTIETKAPSFLEHTYYNVSDSNNAYSFLTAPMLDGEEIIGVLAIRLIKDDIDTILQRTLGEHGETYLISENGYLSTSRSDLDKKRLQKVEETLQVMLWKKSLREPNNVKGNKQQKKKIRSYIGPVGKKVYGLHRTLQVADKPLALITEIKELHVIEGISKFRRKVILLCLVGGVMAIVLITFYAKGLVSPILELVKQTRSVATGDYSQSKSIYAQYELKTLVDNFNLMRESLFETASREGLDKWHKFGLAGLNDVIRGEQEPDELTEAISSYLARYLNAQVAACFIHNGNEYVYTGGFAYSVRNNAEKRYKAGEGLVGQAANDQRVIHYTTLPSDHLGLSINSGLSESAPVAVLAVPLVYEGNSLGVFELGRVSEFTEAEIDLLSEGAESISIALNTAKTRKHTNELLMETQRQSKELQAQQEELKTANEELEEQTAELRKSQQQLQEQSEELKASNEELEEKTHRLQEQKVIISRAKTEVEQHAKALATASKYKTEFLANMSHELRSPLNSLLILARGLAENEDKNLTKRQEEEASIIHNSGTELLHLINDILDLSKVEAGQLDIHSSEFDLVPFCRGLRSSFSAQAAEKGVELKLECDNRLPEVMVSDEQRIGQIMKNLLSNALKFTSEGEVVFFVQPSGNNIAFSVKDTGIGISKDKLGAIFEAFQQADGSTTRKYGGTGLGLTISKQLAGLLGGSLFVESSPDAGSIFTLLIPLQIGEEATASHREEKSLLSKIGEDFANLEADLLDIETESEPDISSGVSLDHLVDKKILIVDDDMRNTFALGNLLKKLGLSTVLAADGAQCLEKLDEFDDIDLVIMDMIMPNMDGFEAIARIREMEKYQDLPVISLTSRAMNGDREKCLHIGADRYLSKPVETDTLIEMIGDMLG